MDCAVYNSQEKCQKNERNFVQAAGQQNEIEILCYNILGLSNPYGDIDVI